MLLLGREFTALKATLDDERCILTKSGGSLKNLSFVFGRPHLIRLAALALMDVGLQMPLSAVIGQQYGTRH